MEFFDKKTSYPSWGGAGGGTRCRRPDHRVAPVAGRAGLNFGIDFTGGVVMEFAFPKEADLEKVRSDLGRAGFGDAAVQSFGTSRDVLVRLLPGATRT